jgi:chromosome segregation protein
MLKKLEISGFKSFAKKTTLSFDTPITAIVGPNGSGKSNVVESFRFVLGEQSMKSMRGKGGSDLVWKGSKFLSAGKNAKVAVTFDNNERQFAYSNSSGAGAELGFDEVTLEREVTTDGGSSYSINGTSVRLKDLNELLGSVNIGTSGHHIISQGEADRLLSASARDRRAMVEDALGLKIFQIRIRESERKLEKTMINMKEVQSLRRELAPHLAYLSKQVEKIQKAEELRKEFGDLFGKYCVLENASILYSEHELARVEGETHREYATIQKNTNTEVIHAHDGEKRNIQNKIHAVEFEQSKLLRERDDLGRAIGRIEGKLEAILSIKETHGGATTISVSKAEELCADIVSSIEEVQTSEVLQDFKNALSNIKNKVHTFTRSIKGEQPQVNKDSLRGEIENERKELENKLSSISSHVEVKSKELDSLRDELSHIEQKIRESERSSYASVARVATLEGLMREYALKRETLNRRKIILTEEIKEAEIMAGEIFSIMTTPEGDTPEKIAERENLHRKLERVKIKLEDAGAGSGSETIKEYEETKARDAFLVKELADLEASITSLRALISELRETIERTFKEGIEKINFQFGEFFKLMFGGGGAFLSIVVEHRRSKEEDEMGDEDLPLEHGIDITVNLPHKKVKDLNMLSGGERSLVSIALLFAMSQVNPPPFLVLDETDAALDEANSRKYGDMLDLLSKHSKLIVVTHNRETMSRAQVLYGVTMGLDGASKLLSIKFDEAVQIAK